VGALPGEREVSTVNVGKQHFASSEIDLFHATGRQLADPCDRNVTHPHGFTPPPFVLDKAGRGELHLAVRRSYAHSRE
jgi:hypothetical protein